MKYRVQSCLIAKFQLVTAMKYHQQWGISLRLLCTSYRFTYLHVRWMVGGVFMVSLTILTKTWTASIYLLKEFLRTWFQIAMLRAHIVTVLTAQLFTCLIGHCGCRWRLCLYNIAGAWTFNLTFLVEFVRAIHNVEQLVNFL